MKSTIALAALLLTAAANAQWSMVECERTLEGLSCVARTVSGKTVLAYQCVKDIHGISNVEKIVLADLDEEAWFNDGTTFLIYWGDDGQERLLPLTDAQGLPGMAYYETIAYVGYDLIRNHQVHFLLPVRDGAFISNTSREVRFDMDEALPSIIETARRCGIAGSVLTD